MKIFKRYTSHNICQVCGKNCYFVVQFCTLGIEFHTDCNILSSGACKLQNLTWNWDVYTEDNNFTNICTQLGSKYSWVSRMQKIITNNTTETMNYLEKRTSPTDLTNTNYHMCSQISVWLCDSPHKKLESESFRNEYKEEMGLRRGYYEKLLAIWRRFGEVIGQHGGESERWLDSMDGSRRGDWSAWRRSGEVIDQRGGDRERWLTSVEEIRRGDWPAWRRFGEVIDQRGGDPERWLTSGEETRRDRTYFIFFYFFFYQF